MSAAWDRFDAIPGNYVYTAVGVFLVMFAIFEYTRKS